MSQASIPVPRVPHPFRHMTPILAITTVAALTLAPPVQADGPFEVVTLDNGLTVLLAPGHAHPVIATELYVTTGNRTEDEYYQGSLHYIEHLVFKGGTPNLEPTQFRKRMSLLGRESGGWTWNDEINFGFEAPRESYREALGVFREALTELQFEEQWFEDEKKVVFQEMERGFERPSNVLYTVWYETAFRVHPYGRDVIGSEKAVGELEMTRTEQYYEDRFSPNHMVLSIAGDFERETLMRWLREEWGPLTRGPESFELGLEEPEQKGPRWREEYLEQATTGLHLVGAVTAGGSDADTPALELLGELLSSSSCGLPQYLEEQKKWVTSVSADQYAMRDYGTFTVYASMEPDNAAAVIPFIRDFLLDFDATKIPAEIFEATRRAALADEARSRETYVGQAGRNGFLVSRLGLEGAKSYVDRLAAVTPQEVQAAKERWITDRKLVAVTVYPDDYAKADDGRRVAPEPPALTPVPDLAVAGALEPPDAAPLAFRQTAVTDGVHGFLFENGLRVLVRPTDASDVLAVSGRVMGGQWVEPEDQPGINRFISELGMRTTRRWSREGFERLTRTLAVDASPHISVGSRANTSRHVDYRDAAAHHYVGLSGQYPEVLAMLKETLFFPELDGAELEKLRTDVLDEIKRLPEINLEYLKQEFYTRAYAGHPYGRPTMGTTASVSAFTPEDLHAFHAAAFTPDRTIVSVVGDVEPVAIAEWISTRWADMPTTSGGPVPLAGTNGWTPPAERTVLELGKDQWTVNWGRPGVAFGDPAQMTSRVLSSMAGNDHFYRYVYEEGVSYRSWIRFWPSRGPGAWILENDVQRERFDEILDMFDGDIARYASEGFSRQEFDDAIQRLVNSDVLSLQENARLAWDLAVAEGNGVGFEFVTRAVEAYRDVTYEETQALAHEVFRPDGILRLVQQ